MKFLLAAALLSLSVSALAVDKSCSPYLTQSRAVSDHAGACDAGVKLARQCLAGNRRDIELVYAALNRCRDGFGGEERLTESQNKKLRAGYKKCSESSTDKLRVMTCMMEVVQAMSRSLGGH